VPKGLLHPLIDNTTNGQRGLPGLSGVAGVVKKHQHELDLKRVRQASSFGKRSVVSDSMMKCRNGWWTFSNFATEVSLNTGIVLALRMTHKGL
jgi:hypothetical protein